MHLQKLQHSLLKHELEQQATRLSSNDVNAATSNYQSPQLPSSSIPSKLEVDSTPPLYQHHSGIGIDYTATGQSKQPAREDLKRATLPAHSTLLNQQPSGKQTNGKKVLSIFHNLLSRNQSGKQQQQQQQHPNESNDDHSKNYSNLKNLKRTTSTTIASNFNNVNTKSKELSTPPPPPPPPSGSSAAPATGMKSLLSFNTASMLLFGGGGGGGGGGAGGYSKSSAKSGSYNVSGGLKHPSTDVRVNASGKESSSSSKYSRRSYDDLAVAHHTAQLPAKTGSKQKAAVSKRSEKALAEEESVANNENLGDDEENDDDDDYDETSIVYSTKNNGLIFLPSPPKPATKKQPLDQQQHQQQQQQQLNYENLGGSSNYDIELLDHQRKKNAYLKPVLSSGEEEETEEFSCTNTNVGGGGGVGLDEDEVFVPASTVSASNNNSTDEGAFDNCEYSYVDNLRNHSVSKQLSKTNLLNSTAAAAMAAAAATALTTTNNNNNNTEEDSGVKATTGCFVQNSDSFSSTTSSSASSSSSSKHSGKSTPPHLPIVVLPNMMAMPDESSSSSSESVSMNSLSTMVIRNPPQVQHMNCNEEQPISTASSVMSLRDRFEQLRPDSPTTNSSNIKQQQQQQQQATCLSTIMGARKPQFQQQHKTQQQQTPDLAISTGNLRENNNNNNNNNSSDNNALLPHSPALSSISTTSSTCSSSLHNGMDNNAGSSSTYSSISFENTTRTGSGRGSNYNSNTSCHQQLLTTMVVASDLQNVPLYATEAVSETLIAEEQLNEPEIAAASEFNIYTFMYKMNAKPGALNRHKFYSSYKQVVSGFVNSLYGTGEDSKPTGSFYVEYILDPALLAADSLVHQTKPQRHSAIHQSCDTQPELVSYMLTLDFFKPLLPSTKFASVLADMSRFAATQLFAENFSCLHTMALNPDPIADDLALYLDNLHESLKLQGGSTANSPDFNLSMLYELLHGQMRSEHEISLESNEKFDLCKLRLKCLLYFKLEVFGQELERVGSLSDQNNQIGARVLKQLEDNLNVTMLELDKFKLLVNESGVITNLLLKLCNKLATIENVIQLTHSARLTTRDDGKSEEIELLKQEFSQTQRKREEAVFLRNGIDKRAAFVSDFLLK